MNAAARAAAALIALGIAFAAETSDITAALERARRAADEHRYQEVIDVLTPFNSVDDPEIRYITAAEIGRAYFHLGQYRRAHRAFRQAVALRPQRAESAVYLQATSFLLGDRVQALTIFEELLKSGARDLYLAVTLSGERRFLGDPGVQKLLERHAIELRVDPAGGTVNGVTIGTPRDQVAEAFGIPPSRRQTEALSAAAGPAVIWAFTFDATGRVQEMAIQTDHLVRYTPYRLEMVGHPGWTPTPAATLAVLGPPMRSQSDDAALTWSWSFGEHVVTMEFAGAPPLTHLGLGEGAAALRSLHVTVEVPPNPDRMPG